ncbi:MAG: DNA polymerase III subunit psi [Cyclobacteriaceae bacterium]|nr:DNA polymerase III subunit psi [Cyclobacteriaceae bacterium]
MTESIDFIYTEELYQIHPLATVVLTKPWKEVSQAEQELLARILTALKLSIDGVTIVHQPKLDLSVFAIKPEKVIYFGALPPGLSYYECIEAQGINLVASEELAKLLANDQARKMLWTALKQLFSP